jgi:hypothetical protein
MMSKNTFEPAYVPISLRSRLIAGGIGLLALALVVDQAAYIGLFEYILWTASIFAMKDPINNMLSVWFHGGFFGTLLGLVAISLRSSITGYAPTKGIVTYRTFGARYPMIASPRVHITEESPPAPVALLGSKLAEQVSGDAATNDQESQMTGDQSSKIVYASQPSQVNVDKMKFAGLPLSEQIEQMDTQSIQIRGMTRAVREFVAYSHSHDDQPPPVVQSSHELAPIQKMLYFLISFFKHLTVTVVLSVGTSLQKHVVELDNRLKAFVAFLATRTKGTKLTWNDLKDHVFHYVEKGSLYEAKRDLKAKVNNAVKVLDPEHVGMDVLVRRDRTKSYVDIALSDNWQLELQTTLLAYHSLIREIQPDATNIINISLEQLREIYEMGMMAYDEKGFLGEELERDKDQRWSWAEGHYCHIRDDQMTLLCYSAKREEEASQQTNVPEIQIDCWTRAARLWREAAFTAMSFHPDLERGDAALRHYLKLCTLLKTHETAQEAVKQYCHRMEEFAPGEQLHPDTLALLHRETLP